MYLLKVVLNHQWFSCFVAQTYPPIGTYTLFWSVCLYKIFFEQKVKATEVNMTSQSKFLHNPIIPPYLEIKVRNSICKWDWKVFTLLSKINITIFFPFLYCVPRKFKFYRAIIFFMTPKELTWNEDVLHGVEQLPSP